MQKDEIRTRLIQIISAEGLLEVEEVKELQTFDGVIDSLSLIVIISQIEAELGISIPKDQLRQLTNLEHSVNLVSQLVHGSSTPAAA